MPSARSPKTLLLDTHVFLWFYGGVRIAKKVTRRIEDAAAASELYVAAMTPWEIAMGASTGRIRVQGSVLQWIETALKAVSAGIATMEPAIAVDAVGLPGNWRHKDPVDRLIVATARHLDAVLVTADTEILAYAAKVKAVRVLEPG
jgi:PIN domain nuclease of toxin-antitoxin system